MIYLGATITPCLMFSTVVHTFLMLHLHLHLQCIRDAGSHSIRHPGYNFPPFQDAVVSCHQTIPWVSGLVGAVMSCDKIQQDWGSYPLRRSMLTPYLSLRPILYSVGMFTLLGLLTCHPPYP